MYRGQDALLVLGNYMILEQLGHGGMGLVFKTVHRRMERTVALKMLAPALAQTAESSRRFQQEVKAAARLSHPNIVIAHDADEADGRPFLVMEYVDGIDPATLVRQQSPLPPGLALDCILQAARGLQYVHEHGVVHRDIKPANLVLSVVSGEWSVAANHIPAEEVRPDHRTGFGGGQGGWNLPPDAPPPAIAPFDAAGAKMHQEAWAKYLGVPVEMENSIGMKFTLIPPGEFDMGSADAEVAEKLKAAKVRENPDPDHISRLSAEVPQHRVRITRPFWLGRHEVTRGQFRRFVEDRGYRTEAERDGRGGFGLLDGRRKPDPRFVWNANDTLAAGTVRRAMNEADLNVGGDGDGAKGLRAAPLAADAVDRALAAMLFDQGTGDVRTDALPLVLRERRVLPEAAGAKSPMVFGPARENVRTGSPEVDWFFAKHDSGVRDKIEDLDFAEFADGLDWILGP